MEVDKCCTENYKDKFRGTPTVEENAEKQYYYILVFFIGKVVGSQKYWQKVEQENDAAKNHISSI